MSDITGEQLAALSAVGRQNVLPRLKLSAESQLPRQAFEVYLDWLDWIIADPDRIDDRMKDVARAFANLGREEQDVALQAFGTYIDGMMEETSPEAAYVTLVTALKFTFRLGWAIVPPR